MKVIKVKLMIEEMGNETWLIDLGFDWIGFICITGRDKAMIEINKYKAEYFLKGSLQLI